MALPWLWAATNLLSLICYKNLTYFPFFYFLWLWEQEGEGRVHTDSEHTDSTCFQETGPKKHTVTLFPNVLLWGFVVIFSSRGVGRCASQ